jgi:starch synthase (maltosyl-transferring)
MDRQLKLSAAKTTSVPVAKSTARSAPRSVTTPVLRNIAGDGRVRAVVDAVLPIVDGGRFAAKCIAGHPFEVVAHAFTDGHDLVRVMLCWRPELPGSSAAAAQSVEMTALGNDEWTASFTPPVPGRYRYTAVAWVDHFKSWRVELQRRVDPGDIRLAALAGATLADEAALRAKGDDRIALKNWAAALRKDADANMEMGAADADALKAAALDESIADVASRHPDRSREMRYELELPLTVDRERAAFSAWYELFPRSTSSEAGRHGTFKDVEARLPYIAEMGFDVLYMPPIHPIGRDRRKGRNNALTAEPGDVGSPWAIGAAEGGHTAILPALGTPEDFRSLVAKAGEFGLEIALDIAFQCAPDHPWVTQHPQWFRWRPDGSVQYAENPPKKYQDIYPFNFETDDWQALWQALKGVFDHWIAQGVNIFRVDNPHTKAFPFWEWAVGEIKRENPQVLFLAEAFTRPKVMHRLAKLGYSQSYTYYTWRNTRQELIEYFTELHDGPGRDYFRPNVWPNTPDILNEHLHAAPRAVFMTRLLLAATLSGNYGIYGPAYELMEGRPRSAGSEEYLDSEKYQITQWDLDRAESLRGFIATVNRARHSEKALQVGGSLRFLDTDNDQLLAYARGSADGASLVIGVVNLDPRNRQSGWVDVEAWRLGIDGLPSFEVEDLLSGNVFSWHGGGNFVILDPAEVPAHLLRVRLPKGTTT